MKFQRTLSVSAFCALLAAMSLAVAQTGRVDPLDSARWGDMHHSVLADAPFEFDDRVRVIAPTTAENPMQVPVTVDATALPGVEEVLVFADFNPIVRVLRFFPEAAPAQLGFRIKLQQSTPVRAAAPLTPGMLSSALMPERASELRASAPSIPTAFRAAYGTPPTRAAPTFVPPDWSRWLCRMSPTDDG